MPCTWAKHPAARIQLEAIGLNIGGSSSQSPDQYRPLSDDGPVAYRSDLPLADWAVKLRRAGVPAQVSYHAGNYLCNTTLYWSHYLIERMALATQSAFIHVPLDISQVVNEPHGTASLPVTIRASNSLDLGRTGLKVAGIAHQRRAARPPVGFSKTVKTVKNGQ